MFNFARYFRKKIASKYMDRFVQDIDYKELKKEDRNGYKYEMIMDRCVYTKVTGYRISHEYFELYKDGRLVIKAGYRWDGPSGITVDTPSFMRSSCVHDIFFQCLRENLFMVLKDKLNELFVIANQELRRIAKYDGMMWPRYHWVYIAVDQFGKKHAMPRQL